MTQGIGGRPLADHTLGNITSFSVHKSVSVKEYLGLTTSSVAMRIINRIKYSWKHETLLSDKQIKEMGDLAHDYYLSFPDMGKVEGENKLTLNRLQKRLNHKTDMAFRALKPLTTKQLALFNGSKTLETFLRSFSPYMSRYDKNHINGPISLRQCLSKKWETLTIEQLTEDLTKLQTEVEFDKFDKERLKDFIEFSFHQYLLTRWENQEKQTPEGKELTQKEQDELTNRAIKQLCEDFTKFQTKIKVETPEGQRLKYLFERAIHQYLSIRWENQEKRRQKKIAELKQWEKPSNEEQETRDMLCADFQKLRTEVDKPDGQRLKYLFENSFRHYVNKFHKNEIKEFENKIADAKFLTEKISIPDQQIQNQPIQPWFTFNTEHLWQYVSDTITIGTETLDINSIDPPFVDVLFNEFISDSFKKHLANKIATNQLQSNEINKIIESLSKTEAKASKPVEASKQVEASKPVEASKQVEASEPAEVSDLKLFLFSRLASNESVEDLKNFQREILRAFSLI